MGQSGPTGLRIECTVPPCEKTTKRFLRHWATRFLSIPYPSPRRKAPAGKTISEEIWADPEFREALRKELKPTLVILKHANVEAIGVFGEIEIKLALFSLIREELPTVQLFTSETDYRLEASPSAGGSIVDIASRPSAPPGGLEGLLVVSPPDPPRPWVEKQFLELDPLTPPEVNVPFLPDLSSYYSYHIFCRFIEMMQYGELVEPGQFRILDQQVRHKPKQKAAEDHCLECYLRFPISKIGTPGQIQWDEEVMGKGPVQMHILKGGRLRPMNGQELGHILQPAFLLVGMSVVALIIPFRIKPPIIESRRQSMPLVGYLFLVLVMTMMALAMYLDTSQSEISMSVSPLPDGHSLFPSLVLQTVACVLLMVLPIHYGQVCRNIVEDHKSTWSFTRWTPPPIAPEDRKAVEDAFREWFREHLAPHIGNTNREWVGALLLGFGLTGLDATAGFPVRFGSTWFVMFLFEWFVLTLVASAAWSYLEIAGALRQLKPFLNEKKVWTDARLSAIEPESIRKLGTAFINSVAIALGILLLLIASRLPTLGMPHWRWELGSVPVGVLFFGLGVLVISAYWILGETCFRTLIREAKSARLHELEIERESYLGSTDPKSEAEVRERLETFANRRRELESISEKPWTTSDAFRAARPWPRQCSLGSSPRPLASSADRSSAR